MHDHLNSHFPLDVLMMRRIYNLSFVKDETWMELVWFHWWLVLVQPDKLIVNTLLIISGYWSSCEIINNDLAGGYTNQLPILLEISKDNYRTILLSCFIQKVGIVVSLLIGIAYPAPDAEKQMGIHSVSCSRSFSYVDYWCSGSDKYGLKCFLELNPPLKSFYI